jgi:hypothetical protein
MYTQGNQRLQLWSDIGEIKLVPKPGNSSPHAPSFTKACLQPIVRWFLPVKAILSMLNPVRKSAYLLLPLKKFPVPSRTV